MVCKQFAIHTRRGLILNYCQLDAKASVDTPWSTQVTPGKCILWAALWDHDNRKRTSVCDWLLFVYQYPLGSLLSSKLQLSSCTSGWLQL